MSGNVLKKAFIAAASLAGLKSGLVPVTPRLTVYDLATAKWPESYAPLHIAIATDMHVGCPSVPLDHVDEIVRRLNALTPDVIILPGDFLCSPMPLGRYVAPQAIAERLGALKAKHGVYAVLGNHEWYEDGPGMWAALEQNNIRVLENDAVKISPDHQDIWIAGLADDKTRVPDIKAAFDKVTGPGPVVMICHDPGTFHDLDERAVVTISGHTHGGQVKLPFAGVVHLPSRAPLRWAYGHIREQNRDLIVSAGLGTSSLPLRFGVPPEIVSLTLRPGR